MKQNVFTKSIQILIISLLILAVIVPKKYSQKGMIIAFLLWLMFSLGRFVLSKKKDFSFKKFSLKRCWAKADMNAIPCADAAEVLTTPTEPVSSGFVFTNAEIDTVLLHLSLRITEKVKSAYPNAVWQWTETPDLHALLSGTSVRISVDDMSSFTHADIAFDRFGRIHVTPMTVGSFAATEPTTDDSEDYVPSEPAVVDVRAWFELVGQRILENHITELNAIGHSKLTIKENGDLVINRQKKEALIATLDAFPGKNYWDELVTIFEENELHAKITGNALQISWI